MPEPEPKTEEIAVSEDAGLIVYCRPWCGDCRRALRWLDEHAIPYTEVDVERDASGLARAESLNGGTLHTPTFEMGADVCVDFRPDRLRELLGIE